MMEFETIIKVIVMAVAAVGIPVGAYAAIAATRSIWARPAASAQDAAVTADIATLQERVRELEALSGHMAELEERLDFAERLLVQQRDVARLPGETEVR